MQIKKERKQTYRYSYTQLVAIKPAKAPGQDSIGTGGQNSIGANTYTSSSAADLLDFYGPGSWIGEFQLMGAALLDAGHYECLTNVRLLRLPLNQSAKVFACDYDFLQFIARMALWRSQSRGQMHSLAKAARPAAWVAISLALRADALSSSSSHLPGPPPGGGRQPAPAGRRLLGGRGFRAWRHLSGDPFTVKTQFLPLNSSRALPRHSSSSWAS